MNAEVKGDTAANIVNKQISKSLGRNFCLDKFLLFTQTDLPFSDELKTNFQPDLHRYALINAFAVVKRTLSRHV